MRKDSVGSVYCCDRFDPGQGSLAEQIIARACQDYLALRKANLVMGTVVLEPYPEKVKILEGDYLHASQAKSLIAWMFNGLQEWLSMADLKIDATYIHRKIGLTT